MTPELSKQDDRVLFLPLCYADILGHLRRTKIDAALFSVAPPDANGLCSFGPIADFLPELWPYIAVRIAHINPAMPRTRSEEHKSELQSLMRISYAVFCLKKKKPQQYSKVTITILYNK